MDHDYHHASLSRRHTRPSKASQASTKMDNEDGNMTISCGESLEVKCSGPADSHDTMTKTILSAGILPKGNDAPCTGELHIKLEMIWDEDVDEPNSSYARTSGPIDSGLTRYV